MDYWKWAALGVAGYFVLRILRGQKQAMEQVAASRQLPQASGLGRPGCRRF